MTIAEIESYENVSGKLLADVFSTMVPVASMYRKGELYVIQHKGLEYGTARLEALRRVYFSAISDALAFIVCGRDAHFLAGVLSRRYGTQGKMAADAEFFHLVYKYESRNITNQSDLLKSWWDEKTLEHAQPTDQ